MPVAAPPLLQIFRSRLQGELLALILVDPARSWTVGELSQRTGQPYQTIATEVRRLQDGELITVTTVGRTKLLAANESNPYFGPLAQLVVMVFGPPLVIGEEFSSVVGIKRLFIFGSWAARYEGKPGPTPNDIDVLVVGEPNRDEIYEAAERAQRRLGHEVNVTIRTQETWESANDGFIQQVRVSPLIELPYPQDHVTVEQRKRGRGTSS